MDAAPLSFRPLRADDLALLCTWLNQGEALRWYARRPWTYAEVVAHYAPYIAGEQPTRAFLICYDGRPIGYIQTYMIADYPDYSRQIAVDRDAAGVDLFIGEADYLHRGLGSAILRRFLREVVFAAPAAGCCVIGPEPLNRAAIRAYAKAGFRYLKTVQLPDEDQPEYLMRIARSDLAAG